MNKTVIVSILLGIYLVSCATGIIDSTDEIISGFGIVSRETDKLALIDLLSTNSLIIEYDIDFGMNPYDDVIDYPQLTEGAKQLFNNDNIGGSSIYSKMFAYEILNRGEYAELLKTKDEIEYNDAGGKRADFLVDIENKKIGITVSRAYHFPPSEPLTAGEASTILTNKLSDIQQSTLNVKDIDKWIKQVLVIVSYNEQHSETVLSEWLNLDEVTRGNTILCIITSNGDDAFLY